MAKPKQLTAHLDTYRPEGRIPPQAVEIEAQVLGAMLTDNTCVAKGIASIPSKDIFYADYHSKTFQAIATLYAARESVGLISVSEELRKAGHLELVGGEVYLADLTTKVTTVTGFDYWVKIILEKYALRRTITEATGIIQEAYQPDAEPYELGQRASQLGAQIINIYKPTNTKSLAQVAEEVLTELHTIRTGNKAIGIPFGFKDIDKFTGGADPGDLVVVTAKEKQGKTTFLIQSMFSGAKQGIAGAIFSAEMPAKLLIYRMACIETGIRWIDLKMNKLAAEQWTSINNKVMELGSLPLFIRDKAMNILDIRADTQRLVEEHGVKRIGVDYAQRIVPMESKTENREREIAAISSGLKSIAMDFHVVAIVLSQINDEGQTRESRALQHDMDKQIAFSHEEDDKHKGNQIYPVELKIRQRMGLSGEFGDAKLDYDVLTGSWQDHVSPEVRALLAQQQSAF